MTNSIEDLEEADCILAIGSNTTEGHPIVGLRIKRAVMRDDCKLIVAEPRHIRLCYYAQQWLRHRPGSDVAPVSYTHLRAHETEPDLVCRLLLDKKKNNLLNKFLHNKHPNHSTNPKRKHPSR